MPEELYTKEKSILLKVLGENPKLRIIDFFLDNPFFDFTKKEVIEALGMNKQTFYKYFREIEKEGIVEVSRKIGRTKLYRINSKHPLVAILRELEEKLSTMTEGIPVSHEESKLKEFPEIKEVLSLTPIHRLAESLISFCKSKQFMKLVPWSYFYVKSIIRLNFSYVKLMRMLEKHGIVSRKLLEKVETEYDKFCMEFSEIYEKIEDAFHLYTIGAASDVVITEGIEKRKLRELIEVIFEDAELDRLIKKMYERVVNLVENTLEKPPRSDVVVPIITHTFLQDIVEQKIICHGFDITGEILERKKLEKEPKEKPILVYF